MWKSVDELDVVVLLQHGQRLGAAGRVMDAVVLQVEDLGQRQARAFAVVHDQDRGDGGIGDALDGPGNVIDRIGRVLDEVVDDVRRACPFTHLAVERGGEQDGGDAFFLEQVDDFAVRRVGQVHAGHRKAGRVVHQRLRGFCVCFVPFHLAGGFGLDA